MPGKMTQVTKTHHLWTALDVLSFILKLEGQISISLVVQINSRCSFITMTY